MNILKYIGLPLLGVVLAFFSNYQDSEKLSGKKTVILRWGLFFLLVLSIVVQAVISWYDDQKADADLVANRKELAETRSELCLAHAELAQANSNLTIQARSIGTLVFNLGTSMEGKRRFARCFQDLSRMTSRREKAVVYEGLICDDGVAVFGFQEAPERLKEFYFFTVSEINYVLAGTPLEDRFVAKDGNANVRVGSELDLIVRMIESRKLPPWSADELERERALAKVDAQMRVVLRYVYRAVSIDTDWWRNEATNEIVSRRVVFSYAANPLAEELRMLSVEVEISKADMESYLGLSVRDFNTRLIERFYASGIEPKVRLKDVRGLNQRTEERNNLCTSPYWNRGVQ